MLCFHAIATISYLHISLYAKYKGLSAQRGQPFFFVLYYRVAVYVILPFCRVYTSDCALKPSPIPEFIAFFYDLSKIHLIQT